VRVQKYCYAALQRGATFSKLILQFFEICARRGRLRARRQINAA
jgi:hypothetical protein